jgi:hypothetical protein
MKEWKVNQRIFQSLGVKTDILGVHIPADKIEHVSGNQIPVVEIQFYDTEHIYLPAKSYCVALVYATELAKDFGGSVTDYLNDIELLPDDKYYVPYYKDETTYDYFLYNDSWITSPMADKIRQYYQQEVHLVGFNNGI